MEHDSNLDPWIQQLEAAVKPYLQFVDQVAEAVADLEPRVMEALRAPVVQVPAKVIGIEPEKFQALERELADQVLIRKSQQAKIDELKAQIATMASASTSVLPTASSEPLSEAVASASAMDLEKFLALEKELEEQVQTAKNQQEKIDELQAQTTLLKTALMEAKAQAMTASESASEAEAKLQTIESAHSAKLAEAKAEIGKRCPNFNRHRDEAPRIACFRSENSCFPGTSCAFGG